MSKEKQEKPSMIIEQWPIERLIEYARNPRKNDMAVDKVASAIKEFGFRVPVLVKSDGSVIDGHLRIKAARKLQMPSVPVVIVDDLSDAQVKAFRLSINKMADLAEWDLELLKLEIEDLKGLDFDLNLTGFDDVDFERMNKLADIPEDNKEIDEESFEDTKNECPKCGFKW